MPPFFLFFPLLFSPSHFTKGKERKIGNTYLHGVCLSVCLFHVSEHDDDDDDIWFFFHLKCLCLYPPFPLSAFPKPYKCHKTEQNRQTNLVWFTFFFFFYIPTYLRTYLDTYLTYLYQYQPTYLNYTNLTYSY
ncbi:hypothetical protein F4809DRAFT_490653 [Biscogniauxia mediterranea]|nr:hypothetical protein F4809DRAFT_490653 [Biscogniauxia mediterranea]